MKFYINKYPIRYGLIDNDNKSVDVPAGTAFQITGITGMCFELTPVSNIGKVNVGVDYNMLMTGFTESDFIDS